MQINRSVTVLVAVAGLLTACDPPAPAPSAPAAVVATNPAPAPSTNAAGANPPATAPTEFAKLKGRWLRPDGGYVIEIKDILTGGKLSAAYFNPRSINVSQAEARKEAGAVKVFIELRDENYPGATYKLTFDPEHDVLAGDYFQPLAGQTYQVQFERIKDEGK
jgi:hypothetical protein